MSGEEDDNDALETDIYENIDTDTETNTETNIDDQFELEDISDDIYKLSLISYEEFNTFYKKYKKDIKTSKILNKYEKTKILSERAEQLSEGAIPLIQNADKYNNVLEIAEEELKQFKIPFIIKRSINNDFEYIKIEDLVIL
tara:strand:- start:354 stop:779 length:426 start_codon:yes stop_codon:yes gene_type:complete